MARCKVTIFMNTAWGVNQLSGFSESYYVSPDVSVSQGLAVGAGIAQVRAQFLPSQANVVGYRATDIDNPHVTAAAGISLRGVAPATDTPWQSALVKLVAAAGSVRTEALRNIPDAWVVNGAFVTGRNSGQPVIDFIQLLVGRFSLLIVDKTVQRFEVAGVSSSGVLTLFAPATFTKGNTLEFLRTNDSQGRPVLGPWKVAVATDGITYTLSNWPAGRVVEEGEVRQQVKILSPITSVSFFRMGTRKVGRPFGQLRGRATSRV